MNCRLCGCITTKYATMHERVYYLCSTCKGVSLHYSHFLTPDQEKKRYDTHNNDITDPRYQKFVSPIVQAVLQTYNIHHKGLDFGSGSGPVITKMLQDQGYNISTYDPFFDPNSKALLTQYNYIACCEVMEHFYNPKQEFTLLHSLLQENGTLYCKTKLYHESIDFDSWWYKNDPTHVFFYTKETLYWIKNEYNYSELTISEKLICFKR